MDKFEIDLAMFEELIWLVESYRGYKLCLLTLSTFFVHQVQKLNYSYDTYISWRKNRQIRLKGNNRIKKTCTTWINGQLIGDKHSVI